MKKDNKKREYNIDLLRIFSCIMIIALHETGYIYGFQIKWVCMQTIIRPCLWVFCAISGYYLLNNKDDIKTFYKKRIKSLILPLIIYCAVLQLLNNIINGSSLINGFNLLFLKNIFTGAASGHLWFIYGILGIYLITPFIKIMVNKLNRKELLLLLIIIGFFTTINPILSYWDWSTSVDIPFNSIMLFYFILGYYISKIKLNTKHFIILLIVEIVNILSIILFFRKQAFIQSTLYTSSINMIISVIFLFELFKRIKIPNKLNKPINYISNRTYGIYIIHLFVLQQVTKYNTIAYTQDNILYLVPIKVIIIFLISLLITSIVYIIKKLLLYVVNKIINNTKKQVNV